MMTLKCRSDPKILVNQDVLFSVLDCWNHQNRMFLGSGCSLIFYACYPFESP